MAYRTTTYRRPHGQPCRLTFYNSVLSLAFATVILGRALASSGDDLPPPSDRPRSQPARQLAPLVAQNLANAQSLIRRIRQIRLNVFSPPWAICHAFLVHGSDFELLDPRTGQPASALRTLLIDPGSAVELHRGAWRFRRATSRRTFERHPSQFSYLILNAGLRPRRTGGETERRLWRIWDRETAEFHTLLDPSWLIPACSLAGTNEPWTNKFGASLDGDTLLSLLEERLGTPLSQLPCGGTHAFYALAVARRS